MSAPHTNVEVQKRRHRGPLVGMAVVVVLAVGLIFYWILEEAANAENPQDSTGQTEDQGVSPESVDSGNVRIPATATPSSN